VTRGGFGSELLKGLPVKGLRGHAMSNVILNRSRTDCQSVSESAPTLAMTLARGTVIKKERNADGSRKPAVRQSCKT